MRICIIGAFSFDKMDTGGQPVKTRELFYLLSELYGKDKICYCETCGWKRAPIAFFIGTVKKILSSNIVIMLPAENGVKVFSRLLTICKTKKRHIYYDVIGGWLPGLTEKSSELSMLLRKFDGIWVETPSMRRLMGEQGFTNVSVLPNFKELEIATCPKQYCKNGKLKLCTFSRVMREKGIEDAISAVELFNASHEDCSCYLDIYGQIDSIYKEKFEEIMSVVPPEISYCGVANPNSSTTILSKYDALLFPTTYCGEGFAGTLLDALFSGLPIIATDWHYNSDIVNESNGFLVSTEDVANQIVRILDYIYCDPTILYHKSIGCIKEATKYTAENFRKTLCPLITKIEEA